MWLLSHEQSQNDTSVLLHGRSQKCPLLLITTDSTGFPNIVFHTPWPFLWWVMLQGIKFSSWVVGMEPNDAPYWQEIFDGIHYTSLNRNGCWRGLAPASTSNLSVLGQLPTCCPPPSCSWQPESNKVFPSQRARWAFHLAFMEMTPVDTGQGKGGLSKVTLAGAASFLASLYPRSRSWFWTLCTVLFTKYEDN